MPAKLYLDFNGVEMANAARGRLMLGVLSSQEIAALLAKKANLSDIPAPYVPSVERDPVMEEGPGLPDGMTMPFFVSDSSDPPVLMVRKRSGAYVPSIELPASLGLVVTEEGAAPPSSGTRAAFYIHVTPDPNILYVRRADGSYSAAVQLAPADGSSGTVSAAGDVIGFGNGAPGGSVVTPVYIDELASPNVLYLRRVNGSYTAAFEIP